MPCDATTMTCITSLPKVIREEGRVAALSHTYAVKSPLVTMARPKFAPKVPLPVDRSPNPNTCLIPGAVRPMMPNGIRIRSAVFPQCTRQTDRPTDARTNRPTDRPRESLTTIGRYATRATRPNNVGHFRRLSWRKWIRRSLKRCLLRMCVYVYVAWWIWTMLQWTTLLVLNNRPTSMRLRCRPINLSSTSSGLLTHSPPIPLRLYTLAYWSNPPVFSFNFWHSGALALRTERQSARMSKIKNGGLYHAVWRWTLWTAATWNSWRWRD